jgi:hypothetical protein
MFFVPQANTFTVECLQAVDSTFQCINNRHRPPTLTRHLWGTTLNSCPVSADLSECCSVLATLVDIINTVFSFQ